MERVYLVTGIEENYELSRVATGEDTPASTQFLNIRVYSNGRNNMYPIFDDEPTDYGWIITKDNIADPSVTPPSNLNAKGMMGPSDCPFTAEEIKAKGEKFRMLDDDEEVYYYGYCLSEGDEIGAFSPLENFGMPNAGCADIQYKNPKTGVYESL